MRGKVSTLIEVKMLFCLFFMANKNKETRNYCPAWYFLSKNTYQAEINCTKWLNLCCSRILIELKKFVGLEGESGLALGLRLSVMDYHMELYMKIWFIIRWRNLKLF